MKIKSVLITGVAGFIGSNLLDYLIETTDWIITGIDNFSTGSKKNILHHLSNSRFRFIENSCDSLKSIREFDCIFHLAALPRIQPSFELITEHVNANLVASVYLIERMILENHFPKFIFSGSSAIYGSPNNTPTDETETVNCLSPYAFQKYEVEKYLEIISQRYPIDFVSLRYFNPYGPRSFNPENKFNAYSSVIGIFLDQKRKKRPLLITGDGSQKRDFVHVKDLARANYLAASSKKHLNTAFNIGRGSTISILRLAKMISSEYLFIDKRHGEADVTFANISKAKKLLGWEPVHSLEEYINNLTESL